MSLWADRRMDGQIVRHANGEMDKQTGTDRATRKDGQKENRQKEREVEQLDGEVDNK